MILKRKDGTEYNCHGLLRCQSSSHVKENSKVYHNRDKNAVMNMLKITESLIKENKRPEKYCRVPLDNC